MHPVENLQSFFFNSHGAIASVSFRGSPPYWFLGHRLPSEGLFPLFCRVLVNPRLLEDRATLTDISLPYCESESRSVMSDSLQPHGLYNPWNSLGQNTGMGSLSCLQGIFPNQGSNPGLLHCRWNLYQLSYQGSLKMQKLHSYFHSCSEGVNLVPDPHPAAGEDADVWSGA